MDMHAHLKENDHLFHYRAKLERSFNRCVVAHLRALMTRNHVHVQGCAVQY